MERTTVITQQQRDRVIGIILRNTPIRATAAEIQAHLTERGYDVTIEQCLNWRREVMRIRGEELAALAQKLAQALPSFPTKAQIMAMAERLGHPLVPGHYKRLLPLLKDFKELWILPRTSTKKITLRGADFEIMERLERMTGMNASEVASFLVRSFVVRHQRERIDLAELLVTCKRMKDDDLLNLSQHFDSLDLSGLN